MPRYLLLTVLAATSSGFELPDLPYDYAALEPYIDEATMRIHHDKHHAKYTKGLNDAAEELEKKSEQKGTELHKAAWVSAVVGQKSSSPMKAASLIMQNLNSVPFAKDKSKFEQLRQKLQDNAGGFMNHAFFWEIMTKASESGTPGNELEEAIIETWGSVENMKQKFNEVAAARFGSGWAWIYVDRRTKKLRMTSTPNQDNPWMQSNYPILGLDLWEHAYYLKYQNRRPEYIKAWWNVVNWEKVNALYSAHSKTVKNELRRLRR